MGKAFSKTVQKKPEVKTENTRYLSATGIFKLLYNKNFIYKIQDKCRIHTIYNKGSILLTYKELIKKQEKDN